MAQCIMPKRGGSGGSSSLVVYAAASVGALPADAKNGDIGIITSDAITSYYVDNDALASPTDGMVRIQTSIVNSAPVQLLPTVKLYPFRASQYISGMWVFKDLRIRYNDTWVMPTSHMYYAGQEYVGLTGGWIVQGSGGGIATKNVDNIYMATSSGGQIAVAYMNNAINFSQISALKIRANAYVPTNHITLRVGASQSGFEYGAVTLGIGNVVTSLDMSAFSGSGYVNIRESVYNNASSVYVYEIWGEA